MQSGTARSLPAGGTSGPSGVLDDAPRRGLGRFAALSVAAAVPFWLLGAAGARLPEPFAALPVTALACIAPAVAAGICAAAEGGLRRWARQLRRAVPRASTLTVAVAVMGVPTLADALVQGTAVSVAPGPLAVSVAVYVLAAVAEELGWTAYAAPRLLAWSGSTWRAGLILGGFWALWHLVPYVHTGQDAGWIAAQAGQAVLLRVAIVHLSAREDEWLWTAVAAHAATNVAWSLVTETYRPWAVDLLSLPLVGLCVLLAARPRGR